MFLDDLMIAIDRVYRWLGADISIDSINGCADGGIVFHLSNDEIIKWYNDGTVVRRGKEDWRK